jgi:uncharacterized membrane protein YtjA (UPF0391 family)
LRFFPILKWGNSPFKNPVSPDGSFVVSPVNFYRKSLIKKGGPMLYWSVTFFVIAIIAAIFGFTGIAASAVYIAKILFFIFLILFIVSLIIPRFRGPPV